MSDISLENPAITSIKFAKLHSPKMKSVFWRHFGFPTNEDNCIITKQNVVCTLCHKVLINHGNTTNLRAHLQSRHKEMFDILVQETGVNVPPRKSTTPRAFMTPTRAKRERVNKKTNRIKLEYIPNSPPHNSMSDETAANDVNESILYESVVPMTYEDDDVIDTNHFTKIEVTNANDIKNLLAVNPSHERKFCTISQELAIDDYQFVEALANFVVQDIRNVSSLYEPGMARFVRTICSATMPSMKKIETYIKEVHSDKHTSLSDQLKMHSHIKPFSLGFEIWTNVEQKNYLSIYFNYSSEAPDYTLVNQIYCTIEYNKFTALDTIFDGFNLLNCTAAVVNCDYDEYLKHYLHEKNIPLILSYDTILNHCIKNVIALPSVASIIDEIKDTLMRYQLEISSKGVEIPAQYDEFPWTYYELLKLFSETLSWPEDVEPLVATSKVVYDIINTLAVTMDTLRDEETSLSSILSPITANVINKKVAVTDEDDHFAASIKTTISETLEKLVLSEVHLTLSALLDPRFHRLITIDDSSCLKILSDKYDRIVQSQGLSPIKTSQKTSHIGIKSEFGSASKKSNLELFFDINAVPVEKSVAHPPNSIATDLERYRADVYVALDESPFIWWNKMSHLYGSLKHLAQQYHCLPCSVNMNYRKPLQKQITEYYSRYMLTGNLIDATMFLYYN